jgi:hypothetical protein
VCQVRVRSLEGLAITVSCGRIAFRFIHVISLGLCIHSWFIVDRGFNFRVTAHFEIQILNHTRAHQKLNSL